MIRRADVWDVSALGTIINDCAEHGLMLHRSLEYLYENVRDFHVGVDAGQVAGVCGLKIVWANLAEVYSLAVTPAHRGKGLGRKLVQACVDEARQLGVQRLMALTYEQPFFAKLGFEVLDREQLPLKVWRECVRCAKNKNCDEIAMALVLEDVADVQMPKPAAPPGDRYIVPVTLTVGRTARRQKMDEAH